MVYSQRWVFSICFSFFAFGSFVEFRFVCARAYFHDFIFEYCVRCVFGSRLFFFCIVRCWSAFPFRCFVVFVVSWTLLLLSFDCLFYGVCMHLYVIAVYGLFCNCYPSLLLLLTSMCCADLLFGFCFAGWWFVFVFCEVYSARFDSVYVYVCLAVHVHVRLRRSIIGNH